MRHIRGPAYVLVAASIAAAHHSNASGDGAAVRAAPANMPIIDEDFRSSDVGGQSALTLVAAGAALAEATGAGVKVAVLDGGFDLRHEYLAGHLGADWDAVDEDDDAQDLGNDEDDDLDDVTDSAVGHGTFVAGLVIACAPDAQILPIRVLDDEGQGDEASLARGILKAVELGADVINLSLVAPTAGPTLQSAIDDAVDAGIVIVGAAGDVPLGPYDSAYLLARSATVGAVDGELAVAGFSPNAALVDLYAPGADVIGPLGGDVEDSYAKWSGTSFSCAFVTAAAALARELHPSMGNAAMLSRLMAATDPVAGTVPAGRGSIDLLEAVTD